MRIAFRADASVTIGSGHVMRCLALANALRAQGDDIFFLCREFPGHLCELIRAQGHTVHHLPIIDGEPASSDSGPFHSNWLGATWNLDAAACVSALETWGRPDWLIVDHYAIDSRWENEMRGECGNIMVIDDLADRSHECDLLLDQNLQSRQDRYAGLIAGSARCIIGPTFALLRPEFAALRQVIRKPRGSLGRLLVFMGGADAGNVTELVVQQICESGIASTIQVDVVIGASNPFKHQVVEACRRLPFGKVHIQIPDIAQLMFQADLMIGAAGSTSWERCCLGLPSIIFSLAENQRENTITLARKRVGIAMEVPLLQADGKFAKLLYRLAHRPSLLRRLSSRAMSVTDGLGCQRVVDIIHEASIPRVPD